MAMATGQRWALKLQALAGWAAFTIIGPSAVVYMRVVRRNRFEGIDEVRRAYRRALEAGRPMVVCANHLTMFDSVFLHHALGSVPFYLSDFRRFSWNVPAVENFKRGAFLRVLTLLGKTIPIDRGGDAAHHKRVLDTLKYLIARGEVCTLFPEGGRSRSGRIEPNRVTYGVGHIVRELEHPQVVCVYMRGERQASYGYLPARGDVLHVALTVFEPTTGASGLRASRDLARQIIGKLKEMEDRYFADRAIEQSVQAGGSAPQRQLVHQRASNDAE